MPRVANRSVIRAILETDRQWSVYALGDLGPGLFEHCDWFASTGDAPALLLLYRGFELPVLFTLGAPHDVRPLLDEIDHAQQMFLHIRPEILPLVQVREPTYEWRMVLDAANYRAASYHDAVRLSIADLHALQRLYADGVAFDEAPDFFAASMLERGVFYGLWEGNDLIAAAGTHLVEPAESVAAVGNVYTRRDRRCRGLAASLTSAVTTELLRQGLRTIGLNVHQHNTDAIRLYERLGFARYCAFVEGRATR